MSRFIGTIVEHDGWMCLQNIRGNAWFPLEGNSGIASDFRDAFNLPMPSDIGRRLYLAKGVLQMESLDQMRDRLAAEKVS
jgi:hypothetical protein